MLILTRTVGQSIKIGENVSVTVIGVKGRQVSVGFDAPNIPVHREEIYERNKMEAARKKEQEPKSPHTERTLGVGPP